MGSWFDEKAGQSRMDVSDLYGAAALDSVVALVALGCSVTLGTTRDGGAGQVTIYRDGSRRTEYFRLADDVDEWLAEAVKALAQDGPPAPQRSGRQSRRAKP